MSKRTRLLSKLKHVYSHNAKLVLDVENKDIELIIEALEKQKGVISHSERDIVNGCMELMRDMFREFIDYLDYIDVDYDLEDMPTFSYSYFHIVQTLLLLRTNHSGGNSTRQKCNELGLDWSKSVKFRLNEERESVIDED